MEKNNELHGRTLEGLSTQGIVMKPCWYLRGLTEEGASRADRIVEAMMGLVANAGPEIAEVALREAVFRIVELPGRTEAYRRKYLKENA